MFYANTHIVDVKGDFTVTNNDSYVEILYSSTDPSDMVTNVFLISLPPSVARQLANTILACTNKLEGFRSEDD